MNVLHAAPARYLPWTAADLRRQRRKNLSWAFARASSRHGLLLALTSPVSVSRS
ncbi:hypothetical protein PCL1606_58110 [Pseudomonas chlororaphis]|uniref:Uncharacterized protein n=1 Tax=Pseudomonas chlororaphis TaxID=587753 RepID=A0A0D5Y8G7_9PSED|nr:hypothetical protein PCL1606_58110 [Pseudomonas chlororaphis]